MDSVRLFSIRGATTVEEDTPEAIEEAVQELAAWVLDHNEVDAEATVYAHFTLTSDLHSSYASRVMREFLQWQHVAFMDFAQPDIDGDLPRCIRLEMLAYMKSAPVWAYLRRTAALRPDLQPELSRP